ncbi:tRNA (N6-isopentenyl adenosine(37)-C2)-methylthiotransferase MiaB [Gaopeijia maritima]|uniref:tRNA (N6-isopentenyl adenosine(37)-C2)-methylthiotransferase MiaB n=1 Tax=Gaopeijia maritima TaxID=3119007 RepID=UPI00324A1DD8
MTRTRRAYVETYGCQMNISDGELMEGILEARGYGIADRPEDADVILVNTCAIREHAEKRVLGRVGQLKGLKADNPDLVLGVTGCMAQRMGDDLARKAPWVDLVMGPDGYRSLPEALDRVRRGDVKSHETVVPAPSGRSKKRGPQLTVLDLDTGENYQGLEQRRTSDVAAWVPIQRGCDHRCTYCIVPYVRGPEKNRDPLEILGEVAGIAAGGVTEVTLLGQTVNSWVSGDWSFARLLRSVARVPGIRRVRFTSPHPNDLTEELVEVMAEEPAVCEQLHLPAQAGNDRTLKRMVRRYTVESFLEKVEMARKAIPDLSLSTDIIVAFPGETHEEFEDTLELMRTVRFDDAFTYKYSEREGTPATRLPRDQFVPDDVAQSRLERLIEVARGIQAEINAGEVGRVEEVLVEKEARDPGHLLGRTRRNKVVAFPGDLAHVGSYRTVALTSTTGATFAGEAVDAGRPGALTAVAGD